MSTYAPNSAYGGAEYFDDAELVTGTVEPAQFSVGTIDNQGTLLVGAGDAVGVSGGFTQTSTGKLEIQLAGAPATNLFGSLTITGAASLAGSLQIALAGGYVPATTDSFIPVTYASETGSFASESLPSGAGYQIAAATTFTNLEISAAPASAVTTTVTTASDLHPAAADLLGINATYWDDAAATSQTEQMMSAAGISLVRFPGGSASDDFHFNVADNYGDPSAITIPEFAEMVAAEGATGIVTVDYGSGSPQEAAAELAYLEGSPSDTKTIGNGIEWNDSTNEWQTVNWGTVGYWASLRAATPLATDDGLNFLRIDHPAAFSTITYWEIGNQEYGSWEIDHHGTALPGGGSTGAQHDPMTYVEFAQQFATLANEITATSGLSAVRVGIDSGDPTGASDDDWTERVLADGESIGFVPGFISDHSYMQAPGSESDSYLLNDTVSASGSIDNWSVRSADYESMLQQTVGSNGSSVQLLATEFNSVYTDPGKQSTSLVNGLFIADSLGSLLDSGYAGSSVWDLRNGPDPSENNSTSLYGWRETGDYGVLGVGNDPPTSGTYVAYPSYFALQLVSKFVAAGGEVVSAASSYSDLDTYALVQPDGDLELLVINANPAAAITSQFDLTGFQPSGAVQVWQYGEAQDTAQSESSSGSAALANSNSTLTLSGADFDYSFPAYSMTVLDVKQSQKLSSISLDLASSNLATSGTEQFAATALDQFGNALTTQPSLTWTVAAGPGTIDNTGLFTPPYVSGSATIEVSSGGISAAQLVTLPGPAVWIAPGGGSWNSSANWQSSALGGNVVAPGTRGNTGDTAEFESGGGSVTLDGDQPTLAALTFSSGADGYIIAPGSGGSLLLENSTGNAAITVLAGNDTIQTGVDLLSNTNVAVATNSSLTISGAISGSGSLNISGGTVTLSGPNSFTGGTVLTGGSLIVENGASLGGTLAIGAGATVTIAPSGPGISTVGSSASDGQSVANSNPAITELLAEIAERRQAEAAARSLDSGEAISTGTVTSSESTAGPGIPPVPSIGPPTIANVQPANVEVPSENPSDRQSSSTPHALLHQIESNSLEIGFGPVDSDANLAQSKPIISSSASTISLSLGNASSNSSTDSKAAGDSLGTNVFRSRNSPPNPFTLSRGGVDAVLDGDNAPISTFDVPLFDLLARAILDGGAERLTWHGEVN